jgi:hypothetical protein
MKSIKASQLQEEVLLAAKEALSVEHNGKLLGYFYPVPQDEAEIDDVWERLDKAVERVMKETGLDEEGLVEALAPRKSER